MELRGSINERNAARRAADEKMVYILLSAYPMVRGGGGVGVRALKESNLITGFLRKGSPMGSHSNCGGGCKPFESNNNMIN